MKGEMTMTKSTLVLLDFINEIVDEKGKFAGKGYPAFVKAHGVLDNVNAAITKARMKNIPVVFVRVGFSPDYREWPESSPLFLGPPRNLARSSLAPGQRKFIRSSIRPMRTFSSPNTASARSMRHRSR